MASLPAILAWEIIADQDFPLYYLSVYGEYRGILINTRRAVFSHI